MPCYHPLPGWYAKERNEGTGKRGIVFNLAAGFKDRPVSVPCGKCIGCQLERARQWAMRCVHEASLYEHNCFVTLTYDDAHLPAGGTLVPEHFVNFMKRLRFQFGPGIRFFHCGEYGSKLERPHHHALLFNFDFDDKRRLLVGSGKDALYESASLGRLWPHGFTSIGECSFESAGYIARYSMKKFNGSSRAAHYQGRLPEYLTMSNRPGIGRRWIEKFYRSVYARDECVVNGHPCKPPRYYDDVASSIIPSRIESVRIRRAGLASVSPERLGNRPLSRETVKVAAIKFLSREFEVSNGS
ncbi:MAG: replication initiator protein [Microvirus sp.]|nr:MAG: replication initiator protein [Microvirus sp.]